LAAAGQRENGGSVGEDDDDRDDKGCVAVCREIERAAERAKE